jgi:hypothetical protein
MMRVEGVDRWLEAGFGGAAGDEARFVVVRVFGTHAEVESKWRLWAE